jgi:hypothetical protein
LIFSAEAYDSLDPNGNITIKWDIMQWTSDGYVVSTLSILLRPVLFILTRPYILNDELFEEDEMTGSEMGSF